MLRGIVLRCWHQVAAKAGHGVNGGVDVHPVKARTNTHETHHLSTFLTQDHLRCVVWWMPAWGVMLVALFLSTAPTAVFAAPPAPLDIPDTIQGRPHNEDMLRFAREVRLSLLRAGFRPRPVRHGRLRTGESYYISTQLAAGSEYYFYAAGDPDLRAIELSLYDPQWQLVTADMRKQEVATLQTQASANGTYHLKLTMVESNAFGAGWFLLVGAR